MRKNIHFKSVIIAAFAMLMAIPAAAITHQTVADGDWKDGSTWDANGVPDKSLAAEDSVIVSHEVTLNESLNILGVVIIEAGGRLVKNGAEDVEVGKGSANEGQWYNYGYMDIDKITVEPGNSGLPTDSFPIMMNFDTIVAEDMNIGNGDGIGALINHSGAKILVASELHIDGWVFNYDTIFSPLKLKVHGGYITGGGYIETFLLDVDQNSGRAGEFNFIYMCAPDGTDPVFDVDGNAYSDKETAYTDSDTSEMKVDIDSTIICGFTLDGEISTLPVELLDFTVRSVNNQVEINWSTALEINNFEFEVQRSMDLVDWDVIDRQFGAGNSTEIQYYYSVDQSPLQGVSYYRLKQIDFDGKSETFSPRSVTISSSETSVYPNPSDGIFFLNIPDESTVQVFNLLGELMYEQDTKGEFNKLKTLDLSFLNTGTYVLRIGGESQMIQIR